MNFRPIFKLSAVLGLCLACAWVRAADDARQTVPPTTGTQVEEAAAGQIAEGWAPLERPDNLAAARQQAIDAALAQAVEQRLGFELTSRREALNHMLVVSRIEKAARGEIADYKILEEKPRDGLYWVKLRVELRQDQLKRLNLDRVRIAFLVVCPEPLGIVKEDDARLALERNLARDGLQLLPISAAAGDPLLKTLLRGGKLMLSSDPPAAQTPANDQAIQDLAQQRDADLVLVVEARAAEKNAIGGLALAEADLRARLYRGMNGQLIASARERRDGERRSRVEESGEVALEAAAKGLSDQVLRALTEQYDRLIARKLIVIGLPTRGEADRVEKALVDAQGIRAVRLQGFQNNAAQWTIELDAEAARRLADVLQHVKGVDLEVLEQRGAWLVARMPVESGGVALEGPAKTEAPAK